MEGSGRGGLVVYKAVGGRWMGVWVGERRSSWYTFCASVRTGAEVGLGPGRERHLAVSVVHVSERERERGRAAHDLALVVVLRAVARAHELVLGLVPRHDAAKVGAHSVEAVGLNRLVLLHDQVGGIALVVGGGGGGSGWLV